MDCAMKCLCCDAVVLVDSAKWDKLEMPVALCPHCNETVPRSIVKVLLILRSQVSSLKNELTLVNKDIGRLYKAQQEFEQTLLQRA